jgi:endoglucanase
MRVEAFFGGWFAFFGHSFSFATFRRTLVGLLASMLALTAIARAAVQITGSPPASVVAGSSYSFQPHVTAPAGAKLVFEVRNKPSWATFNTSSGLLSGKPTATQVGVYRYISIGVSDGGRAVYLKPFSITVSAQTSGGGGTTPPPASAGALALSASTYTAAQSSGSLTVSVSRSSGSSGAVSVGYATSDGTAKSGTDYTAESGTLSWNSGDTSTKSFSVPLSSSPGFTGSRSFNLALSGVSVGASLGTPNSAVVTINGSGASSGTTAGLSIRVQAGHLVDGNGHLVQLRGADVSGLEFTAIQGWSPSDPWGGQAPNWQALQSWKLNAVRIPLNEASWLGLTTYDWPTGSQTVGTARQADPGNNYKQTVENAVNAAVAAGMYVILDLHINSPDAQVPGIPGKVPTSPTSQNTMADADHSIAFWTSVASTFKDNPAVIFDLFNEPHIDNFLNVVSDRDSTAWIALRDGGTCTQFITNGVTVNQNFQTVGMQALLNAVRATGATNVVMSAGVSWAQDTSQWTSYAPADPLNQLAAAWHAYPQGFSGTAATVPGFGTANYTWAATILAASFPVIIGETGDHSAAGTVGAAFMANLLPWVDQNGVSTLGWSWNAWGASDDDLIKDASGTPTDGYGQAFHTWTVNHQ